tara:strand:+ start:57 stop:908 length:852 start_codon:yes stop_codon:yes gene_type:complete
MIIDAHTKIYPPHFNNIRGKLLKTDPTFSSLFSNPNARLVTGSDLLTSMNRNQIDMSIIAGIGWTNLEVAKEANNYLLEEARQNPTRFLPLCSVDPSWGIESINELERCARLGAEGIGELHPDTQNFDITDKRIMTPFMKIARDLELPILIHSSEPVGHIYDGKGTIYPRKLIEFINNFPDNVIICAHWGGGLPFYSLMPEISQSLTNVYFDSAASPLLYNSDIFDITTKLIGAGKILFASDYPVVSPKKILAQIEKSELNSQQSRLILGGNANKLFHMGNPE